MTDIVKVREAITNYSKAFPGHPWLAIQQGFPVFIPNLGLINVKETQHDGWGSAPSTHYYFDIDGDGEVFEAEVYKDSWDGGGSGFEEAYIYEVEVIPITKVEYKRR